MMGQQPCTGSLFYYFRLEDQIPNDHLLKRLDRFVDFGLVRERLRHTYSAVGRFSIDPEVLLRLLVGYLYGITSERRLMDEVRMHLEYRWFFSILSLPSLGHFLFEDHCGDVLEINHHAGGFFALPPAQNLQGFILRFGIGALLVNSAAHGKLRPSYPVL
jgi:Transposase domain (DUF772)